MGAAGRALVLERHDVDREAARLAEHFRCGGPRRTPGARAAAGAGAGRLNDRTVNQE